MGISERSSLLPIQRRTKGCSRLVLTTSVVLMVFGSALMITFIFLPQNKPQELTTDLKASESDLVLSELQSKPSSWAKYKHAAVASDAEQCSTIGRDILKEGGSSVDAAIATSLCIGLHGSQASGIGGGSFMMIYERPRNNSNKELAALDFREMAPLKAEPYMYRNHSNYKGSFSIAVPSEISGYWEAWRRYGRLSWKRLFRPVIDMCRNGFIISSFHASSIRGAIAAGEPVGCHGEKSLRDLLYNEDGTPFMSGDVIKLPKLAKTLNRIAENGGHDFYTGQLAKDIVQDVADMGGIITLKDLKSYKPIWRKPVKFELNLPSNRNVVMTGLPLPSAGPQLNLIFNVISGYKDHSSEGLSYHRLIEAFKFSYAIKTRVGDPEFVDMDKVMKNLTSKSFASYIRSKIDDDRTHEVPYYDPVGLPPGNHGTSQISVYSEEGSAVSLTSTVNTLFGSMCKGPITDIVFNDEVDDFTFHDDSFGFGKKSANCLEGGKRPASSMAPVIVFDGDGKVTNVIGSAGSSRITTTVASVLWHTLYHDMDINKAVDHPRIHHSLMPNNIVFEAGLQKNILQDLIKRGHASRETDSIAYCNAINIKHSTDTEKTTVTAVSDKRKGGKPDGY